MIHIYIFKNLLRFLIFFDDVSLDHWIRTPLDTNSMIYRLHTEYLLLPWAVALSIFSNIYIEVRSSLNLVN